MMEKLSAEEFDRNYSAVLERIEKAAALAGRRQEDIILLAATKTVDADSINYAVRSGISYIGENRVQELLSKDERVICPHKQFIGHLQTNKVKDIISRVEMIQSVDSYHLAAVISRQAEKCGKKMSVLLEVNIGGEESKSGFSPDELEEAAERICELPSISVEGLMSIPPVCDSDDSNRKYFVKMYNLFLDMGRKKSDNRSMNILSMGMSDDFDIAIAEGANLVRVGTALFGNRNYNV